MLPKGTLFSEEGPEIRSVVVAEARRIDSWPPDNFELASNVLDPAANAQQLEHTDFSPTLWDWMPMASRAQRGDWSSSASMLCWCSQAERYPSRRGETPGVAGPGLPKTAGNGAIGAPSHCW
jgi:hypothetical protein